jgi:hypothetical protein
MNVTSELPRSARLRAAFQYYHHIIIALTDKQAGKFLFTGSNFSLATAVARN